MERWGKKSTTESGDSTVESWEWIETGVKYMLEEGDTWNFHL